MEPRTFAKAMRAGLRRVSYASSSALLALGLALAGCAGTQEPARDPVLGSEIDLTRGPGSDEHGFLPASSVEPDLDEEAEVASEDLPAPGVDFPVERIAREKFPRPNSDNPSRGPSNAKIVVQVFSDFECPFCAQVHPVLRKLEELYPGKVRVVWRNFPLPSHEKARVAARAGLEAFAQGGAPAFWRLHDRMFEGARIDEAMLIRHAEDLHLDMARFKQALRDKTYDALIERDIAAGLAAGIVATPSVLVNDYLLTGAYPLVAFRALVEKADSELRRD